jgi:hypothetical protein
MVGPLISGFLIFQTPQSLEVFSWTFELRVIESHLYMYSMFLKPRGHISTNQQLFYKPQKFDPAYKTELSVVHILFINTKQ